MPSQKPETQSQMTLRTFHTKANRGNDYEADFDGIGNCVAVRTRVWTAPGKFHLREIWKWDGRPDAPLTASIVIRNIRREFDVLKDPPQPDAKQYVYCIRCDDTEEVGNSCTDRDR